MQGWIKELRLPHLERADHTGHGSEVMVQLQRHQTDNRRKGFSKVCREKRLHSQLPAHNLADCLSMQQDSWTWHRSLVTAAAGHRDPVSIIMSPFFCFLINWEGHSGAGDHLGPLRGGCPKAEPGTLQCKLTTSTGRAPVLNTTLYGCLRLCYPRSFCGDK